MADSCEGVFGFLFGHKYRARYNEGKPTISRVPGGLGDFESAAELVEASKAKTYTCDVCERCGKIVFPQTKE